MPALGLFPTSASCGSLGESRNRQHAECQRPAENPGGGHQARTGPRPTGKWDDKGRAHEAPPGGSSPRRHSRLATAKQACSHETPGPSGLRSEAGGDPPAAWEARESSSIQQARGPDGRWQPFAVPHLDDFTFSPPRPSHAMGAAADWRPPAPADAAVSPSWSAACAFSRRRAVPGGLARRADITQDGLIQKAAGTSPSADDAVPAFALVHSRACLIPS